MKFFSSIFISAVIFGVAHGHILSILRDFSPIISDLSDSITHVLKDTGGLIGNTFSALDSIVQNAEDSILHLSKSIQQTLEGCPDDPHHQQCATNLRTISQGVNSGILRLCIDETKIRNSLSERLVQISRFRTRCVSSFTKCLKTPQVEQCIKTEVETVRSSIQETEVTLHKDVQSIQTEVKQCVDQKSQQACSTLQSALDDYRKCSGDH